MPPPAPRPSSISRRRSPASLDPGRQPRRDQDLQQDDHRRARSAAPGLRLPAPISKAPARRAIEADRRPAERDHRHRRADPAAPLQVLKDQLLVRSLDGYAALCCPRRSTRESSLSTAPLCRARRSRKRAGSGRDLHRRRLVRRRQQDLRPAALPARDQGCRRRAGEERHRRHGPPHRPARPGCSRQTKARARPSSPTSRPRSAIPSQWRDYSALRSAPATRSAMPCARTSSSTTIRRQARRPIRSWEWGMTPMTINAYANFNMSRDRLPGRDPAAALLRSERRPGDQLWRHRRGDRP